MTLSFPVCSTKFIIATGPYNANSSLKCFSNASCVSALAEKQMSLKLIVTIILIKNCFTFDLIRGRILLNKISQTQILSHNSMGLLHTTDTRGQWNRLSASKILQNLRSAYQASLKSSPWHAVCVIYDWLFQLYCICQQFFFVAGSQVSPESDSRKILELISRAPFHEEKSYHHSPHVNDVQRKTPHLI